VGISGLGTSNLVVASRAAKRVYAVVDGKEHVTLMCAYSGAGAVIPAMFIYKGQRLMEGLMEGAPDGAVAGVSESAWMTEELFYQWLSVFNRSLPPARPVLLILDNHTSRFSLRIIELCIEHQILLLLLPSNATHLMQVGDVSIHAPFKKALKREAGEYTYQHPRTPITRYHYARIVKEAFVHSFTPSNILSGYKATGIHPINPSVIKLCPPPSSPSSSSSPTLPLSDILSIPGQAHTQPITKRKRPSSMPFTHLLTSQEMHTYFTQHHKDTQQSTDKQPSKKRKKQQEHKHNTTVTTNNTPTQPAATVKKGEPKEHTIISPSPSPCPSRSAPIRRRKPLLPLPPPRSDRYPQRSSTAVSSQCSITIDDYEL
jgi:hypothetical protein